MRSGRLCFCSFCCLLGTRGRGGICFIVVAAVVVLLQRGSRGKDQQVYLLLWITAGAVWSSQQEQLPDHSTACGPGAGDLMITKEAAAPLVAQFCSVALRAILESSTSSLYLWPSQ